LLVSPLTHPRNSFHFARAFSGSTKLRAVNIQPLISNLLNAFSLSLSNTNPRIDLPIFQIMTPFATNSHNFAAQVSTFVPLPLVTLASNHGAIFVSIRFPIAFIQLLVDQLSHAVLY
jgi:hypothetical protein